MKKRMLAAALLFALLLTLLPVTASAAESGEFKPGPEVNYSLKWKTKEDGTVIVTGKTEGGGPLVLPSEIDGKAVTEIGDHAFHAEPLLTGDVSIPGL